MKKEIKNIDTTAEWTSAPDLMVIDLDHDVLDRAKSCLEFMKENKVQECTITGYLAWDMYVFASPEDSPAYTAGDGTAYIEADMDYRIGSSRFRINDHGMVYLDFPFKDTSDKLSCYLGQLDHLQAELDRVEPAIRLVKVIVLCENSEGAPEFHTCTPEVTAAQYAEGYHYELAKENAEDNGYKAVMAFDESDPAAKQMGEILAWL